MSFGDRQLQCSQSEQTIHEFRGWHFSVHNRSKHFMSFGVGVSVFTIGAQTFHEFRGWLLSVHNRSTNIS